MPRLTKDQRLANLHSEALKQFDAIQSAVKDERQQCLQDRRFYSLSGAQWEGSLSSVYENKPKFEVNKIHLAVIRIINDYRNNRISVSFSPKDGAKNDDLSDVCAGLFRADEKDSVADEAYDNAFEEAVGGGIGAWRLRACYEDDEDDENERQRIRFEPIYDADSSVFFDLSAKRQDKSDANHCFVIYSMPRQDYIDEWGDDPASWPKTVHQNEFDWLTPDVVYLAEYYKRETTTETIRIFRDLTGQEEKYSEQDFEADETLESTLQAVGSREIRQRKIKTKRVRKYIMSGGGVLEDCGYIAGKNIPIVPVYGKRWFVDNVERQMGHVRLAKDAQRLKNMQLSKLAEISVSSSVEKPIFTPEQVSGHQVMWTEDDLKNYPFLLVNPITGPDGSQTPAGPIGYTKAPNVPPAMAALLQVTEQDMQEILGSQQNGEKIVSNISGKAVEMIQQKLDMQSYIYISNFAKAMKRSGEIWLSMARELYAEEGRRMKIIDQNDKPDSIIVAEPGMDIETSGFAPKNDIASANFDVDVEIGPTSKSRKDATVRALMNMMQVTQDPQSLQVLAAMAVMNMEGEGLKDVQGYYRKQMLQMGVVKPTEEEAQELAQAAQNQQPDPNAIYLQAAAEEATAKAATARAQTIKTVADAELSRAKTAETMAKTAEISQGTQGTQGTIDAAQQMQWPTLPDQQI